MGDVVKNGKMEEVAKAKAKRLEAAVQQIWEQHNQQMQELTKRFHEEQAGVTLTSFALDAFYNVINQIHSRTHQQLLQVASPGGLPGCDCRKEG